MVRLDLAVMTFDLTPSGVVRNALRIAASAKAAGLETEIWTVQPVGEMRDLPADIPVRSFGETVGTSYNRRDRKAAALASAKALGSMLATHRPRIALSAGNHFHELAVAASRSARPGWTGRLVGRVSNDLPRFSWAPARIPGSLLKRLKARRRFNAMDRLVTVSAVLRDDLVKILLLNPARITVVPNGIDLDDARLRASEPIDDPWFAPGQPPVVLGVGRLVPQKDFAGLVRAFASARRPRHMRLVILGDGPDRQALEALAVELGVAADVRLAGHCANPMPYYKAAGLFVLSSRWEGMSNALLEAMAVGCPVVATACPGSVELLGPALASQIVPVGNEESLSQAIAASLRTPPERSTIMERASKFSLRSTMDAYVQLLNEELRQG